ncbi:MAG TPA: 1-deoxy-D-xylulose-5-phosphate reductoisomerase [Gammaproteobacteria bacterium]|nr:1-deoxy-D-xylulose-5-phosphate reductoisomerase [Gammaproteobacteria bacterium]
MNQPIKHITLLGATGSIGMQTLEVIKQGTTPYQVFALSAHTNVHRMLQLCQQHAVRFAVMSDEPSARRLAELITAEGLATQVLAGSAALLEIATHPEVDTVMAAIVGSPGLAPTLAAVHAGKRVLLANKEALVMTGQLFMDAAKRANAMLLPIDSEHNAIFQCLPVASLEQLPDPRIKHIYLTASGGPFLDKPLSALASVTPDQACAHPNWQMGKKISIDSATMMNKALEVIEAYWLFSLQNSQIKVVIHPQSIIHSMVEYHDGSILAQLGYPDMRTPIAHALAWPQRIASGAPLLELFNQGGRLDFLPPDPNRFPVLDLAREVLTTGGTASAIFNAANEVAVAEFLRGAIKFLDIPNVIAHTLEALPAQKADDLDAILAADHEARHIATARSTRNVVLGSVG